MIETPGHRYMNGALRTLERLFEVHRERSPFRELLDRFRGDSVDFGVAIYEAGRPTPIDHYEIALKDGKFAIRSQGAAPPTSHWSLST